MEDRKIRKIRKIPRSGARKNPDLWLFRSSDLPILKIYRSTVLVRPSHKPL